MSKAVICDRCKRAIAEQNAFRINVETTHYDLCPECRDDFNNGFMRKSQTQLPESLMGDE